MQLIATKVERWKNISDNLKEHNVIKYKEQSVLTIVKSEFLAIYRLDWFNYQ